MATWQIEATACIERKIRVANIFVRNWKHFLNLYIKLGYFTKDDTVATAK